MERQENRLADSPWFWALVFCGMGLLGVWAISGKYDDRQKRMEARYEARLRIAEEQVQRGDAANRAAELGGDDDALQSGYTSERRVPLRFLAGGLVLVSLLSLVMLIRAGRSIPRKDREEAIEPQRR